MASIHDLAGELRPYEKDGRLLADCPSCGQAGSVTRRRDGIVMFDCFARCGAGSGIYRETSANGAGGPVGDGLGADIRRSILDDAQIVGRSGQETQEPIHGTNGLLYRGASHMIFGTRESGKTLLLLIITISAANAGERVLYLDLENGEEVMRERIDAILDANPDWPNPIEAGQLTCASWPTLSRKWKPAEFAAALADFTMVVFDPLHATLETHGLEEKDGFGPFVGTRVAPLRERGITVVLADNIGHENHDRPRGDSRKLDAVPQVYKATAVEPFDQVQVGRVRLTCKRSRFGDTSRQWEARIGGDVFELPATASESPKLRAAKRAHEREGNFRTVVLAVLAEEPEPRIGHKRLLAQVRDRGIRTRTTKALGWLAAMAADPASGLAHDQGGYGLKAPSKEEVPRGGSALGSRGGSRPLRVQEGGSVTPRTTRPSLPASSSNDPDPPETPTQTPVDGSPRDLGPGCFTHHGDPRADCRYCQSKAPS